MRRSQTLWAHFAVILALVLLAAGQAPAQTGAQTPKPAGSAGQTAKYSDLVNGGRLPYGKSVTATGAVSGHVWTAPLGQLPSDNRPMPSLGGVDVTAAATAAFTKNLDRFANLYNIDLNSLAEAL